MLMRQIRVMVLAAVAVMASVAWSAPETDPAAAPAPAASNAKSDLPSAEQVLADSVKALGGKEAIDKIQTIRASVEIVEKGDTRTVELCWSRNGGRLSRTTIPSGVIEMGTDGTIAWRKGPTGFRMLTKPELSQLNESAGIFMDALEPQRTAKEKLAAVETWKKSVFAGRECHRLHFTNNKNGKQEDLFYDLSSALPAGFDILESKADDAGDLKTRTTYGDWKEVNGVKLFSSVTIESVLDIVTGAKVENRKIMTMTCQAIEVNTLDDAAFAAPEEAKKLVVAPAPPAVGGEGKEIKLEDLTPEQRKTAEGMIDRAKKSGNVQGMKDMVSQIEPMLSMFPADQRPGFQYAIQELKKEIARLGGG